MLVTVNSSAASRMVAIAPSRLRPSRFSQSIYGDSAAETDDLLQSIRDHGILVPLVVAGEPDSETWEVISGHRRLACAVALGLTKVPCEIRSFSSDAARCLAVLEYNRQRQKSFSQTMREADALEELWKNRARSRRLANLRRGRCEQGSSSESADRRNSDDRWTPENSNELRDEACREEQAERGRTDARIAQTAWNGREGSLSSSTCGLAVSSVGRCSSQEWCCSTRCRNQDDPRCLQGLASS